MKKLLVAVTLTMAFSAFGADKAKCEKAILNTLKLKGMANVPAKIDYSKKDDLAVIAVESCVKSSTDAEADCAAAAKTPADAKACKGKK